ncbi:MAG TPA: cellulase family glycosylhydrolase [Miltoncostaeaceae bacterium]|nr:cellulase family glycosylhydrolase [Miltoncostaeaceae bacterium]
MKKPLSTRRALTGAAIAAAAGAALALPSTGMGGVAAIQDDILTTAPSTEIPARLQLVRDTRAKVTRFDILWSFVATRQPVTPADPADPAYDWSRVDQVLIGFDQANITPIVSTYSTPAYAVAGRKTRYPSAYNPNAPTATAFGAFMRAVATRYSGRYPNPAGGTLPRVRHYEIWNEPNLKNFFRFNNSSNIGKYKGLVKAAYTNIKAANPNAIVIAGVGGPRSSGGGGNVSAKIWMDKLVADKSVKFDAYSQHIYPSRGPKFTSKSYAKAFPTWDSLQLIYDTLDKKRKGMKLYVTEAGYTTGPTPFRTVKVSPSQQRTYLRQLFNLPLVKSPRMAAVVWFNLEDNRNWPGGLLRANGSKKPSYSSFVTFARRPIPGNLRSALSN